MVLRKASVWLGLVEQDDDDLMRDEHAFAEPAEEDVEESNGQVAMGEGFQIATVRARTFRDAATIGEYYRQDIPVIINLEEMEDPDARRIVDFASGLILGRHGEIERLSRRIFLLLPADTTILTAQASLTDQGFFNQA
ncbi:cell division protein SepF [Actinomadura adrarensis]|uniref:Cell division protein SepF n=1 Tax=Actinomadura adrarensis TaxID=1819600 RepID=A0ABW3CQX4_9ACTN